ncbi:MAG: arginine repressor [Eubacteriales bacterium]
MKSDRQNAITDLITRYEIETQEDMINRLRTAGYDVTQATVSRDIRELKLTKVLTPHGTYRYVKNHPRSQVSNARFNNAVADSITGVDYSQNIVVIKTYPGLAMAVASGIDALNFPKILGCIAGDDTVMVVTRSPESSEEICDKIKELRKIY